jgi:hypothetical protein
MKNILYKIPYYLFAVILFAACTNLEVEEMDSLLTEDESGTFSGVDPNEALSSAYKDLRSFATQSNLYALSEVTSDELLVPTRGTDWGDNGVWRTLHQQTWDASHQQVLNTWNNINSNVYKVNQIIAPVSQANAQQLAEAKFLRAYNMFLLLDLFGQIPFREVDEGVDVDPRVMKSSEAFDFILKDLNEALPDLPEISPGVGTIQASKAAGNFLMAKLLLNKHIYVGGEPSAADMTKVVQHVNAIKADGFDLQQGYFELFTPEVDTETILYTDGSYSFMIWDALHYNQTVPDNSGGGWNGFSTTADFYALFEGDPQTNEPGSGQEERRGFVPTSGKEAGAGDKDEDQDGLEDGSHIGYGFLFGQQYGLSGNQLKDRAGNPLFFTKEFPGLTGNNERNGIRVIKYHPSEGAFGNHYILFRYADAHLMKAEAIARGGESSETALQLVNELREIRNASPLQSLDMQDILDERARELYIEGWRRNDQIRFGTFTQQWAMKDNTEEFRVLFPIPETALTSNPNLEQNPGY